MPHEELYKQKIIGDRWKNRRKMAWLSLLAGVLYPLLILYTQDGDALANIAMPYYTFLSAVLASYFGWSSYDDIKRPTNSDEDD